MTTIKNTDSTLNRPQGKRTLDAPAVFADLKKYAKQLRQEKAQKGSDRNAITIFKNSPITIVLMALKEKATINDNNVNGFLTIQVIKGTIILTTPEGKVKMKKQQVITLHPEIKHSMKARKKCLLLLTSFHQVEGYNHTNGNTI